MQLGLSFARICAPVLLSGWTQPYPAWHAHCSEAQNPPQQGLTAANSIVPPGADAGCQPTPDGKTRLVVLGSGWAGACFIKDLKRSVVGDSGHYHVSMVSPRNYFVYTPLLASAATGTVEGRSIVQPIRNMMKGKGTYYEAKCLSIDPFRKVLLCESRMGVDEELRHTFELPYDILVLGVGSINNTFGVEGVEENCFFMKTIHDANNLRHRMMRAVEQAALPCTTPEQRSKLLTFVVVGGGPSGVEVAAELHDLFKEDVAALFPGLERYARVKLINTTDHLLSSYDRNISKYTADRWERSGIELVTNTRVKKVEKGRLIVTHKGDKEDSSIEFGTCVWTTGTALHPLVADLKAQLPKEEQTNKRALLTDPWLRVLGTGGSIYALGDCATVEQGLAVEHAKRLFEECDVNHDGYLSREEMQEVLERARKQHPQFAEHVRLLDESNVWDLAHSWGWATSLLDGKPANGTSQPRLKDKLNMDDFVAVVTEIDNNLRALPATAQVAHQQAAYLAKLFSKVHVQPNAVPQASDSASTAPTTSVDDYIAESYPYFKYKHLGSLAYIGGDSAVMELPLGGKVGILKGWMMAWGWRGMETLMQISLRNQYLVANDMIRTKIYGRDVSDV